MKRVVFNAKGGVGKSTITCNLAAYCAKAGQRTLVIDLDGQANSTQYLLGHDWEQPETNVARYLEQTLSFRLAGADPADYCVESKFPGLWVMPATPDLADVRTKLEAKHKIFKLREALEKLSADVDQIFIDTPPAFDFYTFSALIGADRCLIPFDCDDFSRRALMQLLDHVAEIKADHNRDLEVEGIIVNQYQPRSKLPQRIVAGLEEQGLPVLDPKISSSVVVRESHEACEPLAYFKPAHKVSRQFEQLTERLMKG